MERRFEHQLEKLKSRLIKMGSLVSEQVENVIHAVELDDKELAAKIIELESKVDKYDIKIEKQCLKMVVLNQPVAIDLRFVFSAVTINSSLERIGDLAVNVAKGLQDVELYRNELEMINFDKLSEITRKMLNKSIDTFINMSGKLAKEVFELEKSMNIIRDNESITLKNYLKNNPERVEEALFLYDMIHAFERMGDICTNIVEDVYFIIEAQNIRHKYADIIFGEEGDDNEDDGG